MYLKTGFQSLVSSCILHLLFPVIKWTSLFDVLKVLVNYNLKVMDILIFTLNSVSLVFQTDFDYYHMKRSITKNNLTLKDILMITLDSMPLFDISNRFWYCMKRSFTNTKSTHRIFKQHHLHSFDGSKWWNRTSFSYTMTAALKELTNVYNVVVLTMLRKLKFVEGCMYEVLFYCKMKSMYILNK